jgi:thiol:disulfide interchange protein DsbD
MIARLTLISAMFCTPSMADVRSGNATVEWIAGTTACEAAKPLRSVIRMVHEPGWHSYWINPGEAGIKTSVVWKLPPGWKTDGPGFPPPARFLTSGLAGFGYGSEVLFPVTVTPPADFTGKARLTAVVSWLACGERGCVPGKAEIHLDLASGAPESSPDARLIDDAYQKLPRPAGKTARLTVTETGKNLTLLIETEPGAALDLDGREVFPATPEVIDPRALIRFVKKGAVWTSGVPKSEYADGPVKQLTLVLASKENNDALELTWAAP